MVRPATAIAPLVAAEALVAEARAAATEVAAVAAVEALAGRAWREDARLLALGLQAGDLRDRDGLRRELLDAPDHRHVLAQAQRDRQALAAGAAGAADAVHIVLGLHRQAVVDDVADGRHVDAAGRDVGGHQHLQVAAAQAHQHAVALALRHRAVQRGHRVADLGQTLGQPVGIALGAGEDHGLVQLGRGQDGLQQLVLVVGVVGPVQALLDVLVRLGVRGDLDALGFLQQLLRQAADVAGEGGAEHHGLLGAGRVAGDDIDVVDEAHVQHAVGFVQHQHLDIAQHALAAGQVVQQAAGRGNQHLDAGLECGRLRLHVHTAEDDDGAQIGVLGVLLDVVGDLVGQLARGRQHQRPHRVTGR
mmetsp:Transcript_1230/g.3414  ORF Transcript_1230/g.3414 Transcript_1230/m.3414 type:complete len:361 (+) Transcript_1230:963-2045(+)